MYTLKDISVIIPTFNRSTDLKSTLSSFRRYFSLLGEVIIVDQSKDTKTRKFIASINNNKIKYILSPFPSLTHARNLGVSKALKSSKIICFLDDDVTLDRKYFDEILKVFNANKNALGVSGYFFNGKSASNPEIFLRKLFFIEHNLPDKAKVLSVYGNTYPSRINKNINAEWLTGFNMSFKKEIFDDFKFDENLTQYALAEDFDFSYRINKRYPSSLYITPYAKLVHRVSVVERIPTEKISFMNQVNHVYLNYKNFNSSLREKVIFIWVLFGITLLRIILYCKERNTTSRLKLTYYIKSLMFVYKHRNAIKKGKLNFTY